MIYMLRANPDQVIIEAKRTSYLKSIQEYHRSILGAQSESSTGDKIEANKQRRITNALDDILKEDRLPLADQADELTLNNENTEDAEIILDKKIDMHKLNKLATFIQSKGNGKTAKLDDSYDSFGEDSDNEFEDSNSFSKSILSKRSDEDHP